MHVQHPNDTRSHLALGHDPLRDAPPQQLPPQEPIYQHQMAQSRRTLKSCLMFLNRISCWLKVRESASHASL